MILNEAKSTTLYDVWLDSRSFCSPSQPKQQRYYLNIGPLSWDAYLVCYTFDMGYVGLSGAGRPVGGSSGLRSWDDIFIRHVQSIMEDRTDELSDLIPEFGDDRERIRRVLAAAVQPAKQYWSIRHSDSSYYIRPELDGESMEQYDNSYFSTEDYTMKLKYSFLRKVSEECLRPIIDRVHKHIDELFATLPDELPRRSKMTIALEGGSRLPCFALELFQDEFKDVWDVDVIATDTRTPSAIAGGNYLTLCDASSNRDFLG